MIRLISLSNNKYIICYSILLKIINNKKKYDYIINQNIYDDIMLYEKYKFINKTVYDKIDEKIKRKDTLSITVGDFIEMYYIFYVLMINNLKKYDNLNIIDNICLINYILDNIKINYNTNKKYINNILLKLYEEYDYIIKNKNIQIKIFIKYFIKKFYPDIEIKKKYKKLDYNANSMHFISSEYLYLLYNKYTKLLITLDK
ncbi:hypothetical protein AMV013 [Betaentomopoxvirus amoorei]|uniref:AMV013 n=1 Tax=Amsacta moorei entomopoxvirus TaxID=28321 RepID=Q9EN33_AMEPV|nr:hypothetical protein AMV013 [Amsacta moorei entomopoxvirus]AAG02719.1 AMV013 [Amsacta moorei entomopoxvirus]